jgi:hypothetical protein
MTMLRKVDEANLSLSSPFNFDLPKDSTLDFVDIFVKATVTGAGGGTNIGAYNLIADLQLQLNGIDIFPQNMTGREAYFDAAVLMGELMEEDSPDPSGGSVSLFFVLRLWLMNIRGRNPRRTRLDVRAAEDFRLKGTIAAATSACYSGGTQAIAASAINMKVIYGEHPGRGGDAVLQRKRFSYTFDGSEQTFDWRENGAALRSMLIEEFESNDTASDDELQAIELITDGKVRALEPFESLYMRAKSTYASQLSASEIPTGLSFHDLDPRTKGGPRISLQGNNVQLKITGEADSKLVIIRNQTVGVEIFGLKVSDRRRRR